MLFLKNLTVPDDIYTDFQKPAGPRNYRESVHAPALLLLLEPACHALTVWTEKRS